jgi:hypothetical protein
MELIISGNAQAKPLKMSPIRHSTLCKSMIMDIKDCAQNCSCFGCNLLKNCKLMLLHVTAWQSMQCWPKPIRNAEVRGSIPLCSTICFQ